ncbi:hypothetical protein L484_014839 [Morus notabilis]|uniref:Uncharacterized protein n=1 Tax=Morus notabilis TaxID=981085 RepID=W9QM22_9ROSA|nr:hypothetical protein L484_014839 [Morus notabilis]
MSRSISPPTGEKSLFSNPLPTRNPDDERIPHKVVGSLTTENEALKAEADRTRANAIAKRINAKRNYDQIMRAVEDIKDEGVKTYAEFIDYRFWMNLPHVVGGNSGGNRESPNNSSTF